MPGPYPKKKYHKTRPAIVVGNEQEEFNAGGGYYDTPIQEADIQQASTSPDASSASSSQVSSSANPPNAGAEDEAKDSER